MTLVINNSISDFKLVTPRYIYVCYQIDSEIQIHKERNERENQYIPNTCKSHLIHVSRYQIYFKFIMKYRYKGTEMRRETSERKKMLVI